MRNFASLIVAVALTAMILGPFARATDGTSGTSGPAMLDAETDRLFDSQHPDHVLVINGTTVTLTGHGTSTVTVTATGAVAGTGTTNYVPKWTGASTLGDSHISDNGTSVSIGSSATVAGTVASTGNAIVCGAYTTCHGVSGTGTGTATAVGTGTRRLLDATPVTLSVNVGTGAGQVASGSHNHGTGLIGTIPKFDTISSFASSGLYLSASGEGIYPATAGGGPLGASYAPFSDAYLSGTLEWRDVATLSVQGSCTSGTCTGNAKRNVACPSGQFVAGVDTAGDPVCSTPSSSASGMTCAGTCSTGNWVAFADSTHVTNAPFTPANSGNSIATTNGLQGGGTLTTTRTLSPVYGSTANTVMQGNDRSWAVTCSGTCTSGRLAEFTSGTQVADGTAYSDTPTASYIVKASASASVVGWVLSTTWEDTPTTGFTATPGGWGDLTSDTFTHTGGMIDVDVAVWFESTYAATQCGVRVVIGANEYGVRQWVKLDATGAANPFAVARMHALITGESAGTKTLKTQIAALNNNCSVPNSSGHVSVIVRVWRP
jgi:hypothetical protein